MRLNLAALLAALVAACNDPYADAADEPAPASTSSCDDASTGAVDSTGPDGGSTGDDTTGGDTTGGELPAVCGDGEVQPGEDCDAGVANSEHGECLPTCQRFACGDGFVLWPERAV